MTNEWQAVYEPPVYPQQQASAPTQQPYGYDPNAMAAPPPGASGLPQPGEGPASDDIDNLIRMAEAGVRPPQEAAAEPAKATKKGGRMFYDDAEISPEERMAQLPRYVFAPAA